MPGRGKCRLQDPVNLFEVFVRAAADAATESRPRGGELREILVALQQLARRHLPILDEGVLHLSHHRPGDLEVKILHATGRSVVHQIPLGDVHPPGDSGVPVNHQDLSMIAQVEPEAAERESEGKKRRDVSPGFYETSAHA